MEQLYIEVLCTIKYKVGSSSSQPSQYQEELYSYAQKAFKVSNDMHRRYLSIASEEKVSCYDILYNRHFLPRVCYLHRLCFYPFYFYMVGYIFLFNLNAFLNLHELGSRGSSFAGV